MTHAGIDVIIFFNSENLWVQVEDFGIGAIFGQNEWKMRWRWKAVNAGEGGEGELHFYL